MECDYSKRKYVWSVIIVRESMYGVRVRVLLYGAKSQWMGWCWLM